MSEPFLVNRFGDRYLHAVNGNAFNHEGARTLYRRHFGNELDAPDTFNLVAGSDSGLLIEEVLARGVPEGSRFLFVEPEGVLERIRERFAERDLGPDLVLASSRDWRDRLDDLGLQDYLYLGRARVLRSLAAADGHLAEYPEILWTLRQELETINWRLQATTGNRVFIERQMQNLGELRHPAAVLKDAFAGATAVILGGGPSLPRLFPWIQAHRDRVLVIAVSRVCRQLLAAGIRPHMVVTIDPHDLSFDVSRELLLLDPATVVVHAYHASPLLVGQWPGPNLYLGPRYPWKTKAEPANLELAGPTVTNAAMQLALDLGVKQIILGGVDLCFSREGYTHAEGSNEQRFGPLLNALGTRVETNAGDLAESRPDFTTAIALLAGQAHLAAQRACRVLNPIPEAAWVEGVEHIPLDRIAPTPVAADPQVVLRERLPAEGPDVRRRHYGDVLRELAHARGRLRAMQRLALKGLECNDGLFGRNGKTADFKYKHRMDRVERRLDREFGDLAPLVKSFADLRFLKLVRPRHKEWTDEEIEAAGRHYYETYRDSATELINLIDSARERVQARLEEESPAPDFDRLAARWLADGQPGRARVWRAHHPDRDLPPEAEARFRELDQAFEALMAEEATDQQAWVAREYDLGPVPGKVRSLFQKGDREGLEHLARGLEHSKDPRAPRLSQLVRGSLAELDGDLETAFSAYSAVLDGTGLHNLTSDHSDPVLEESLNRVAALSLNAGDSGNAALALGCLASLSPVYRPHYAEILRLRGDIQGALDAYGSYLEQAPDDLGALLRLGRLYLELGARDSARLAFEHILAKDPADRAARQLLDDLEAAA